MSGIKKFKGEITFKVEDGHPDIQHVKNPKEELKFQDTYTFSNDYNKEDIHSFIRNDLSIVAGGGYTKENISNVSFDIKQI